MKNEMPTTLNKQPLRWAGPIPKVCDTCDAPIHKVFYDANTVAGIWACMCVTCFVLGPGVGKLGTGFGQEYTKRGEHWVKTRG